MGDVRKVIIIGSGPAGYTAGVYTARAELGPLIFAGENSGGQLMNTTLVENWPGNKDGVMGPDLMIEMREQAKKFGAEIIDKDVGKVDFSERPFKIWVGKDKYLTRAVIIATGASSLMLNIPGEKKLLGKGVATCAVCDAPFYRDRVVFVIGGGDAACEDALALTKFAKSVTMLVRRDKFRASKIMERRAKENTKISVIWNTEALEFIGKEKLNKIRMVNNKTNKESVVQADGVFLAIGHKPATGIFKDQIELDQKGYILTFNRLAEEYLLGKKAVDDKFKKISSSKPHFSTCTSELGLFAAGDVVDYKYQQAVTAAGMGCQAALDAEKWLEGE